MSRPTTPAAADASAAPPSSTSVDDDHTPATRLRAGGPLQFRWVAPVMGAYLGVWMVRRMWGSGLIAGADSTAILARTDRTIDDVLANGQLNGWSPYFSLGHDAFLINPPGFTFIIAMIRLASFGQLSTAGAIKVAVLLSFVVLPLAVAYCARSLGADRRAASLTGILSLVVSLFAGFGVRGVFETGLYPFQVAAPLFFFALGALVNAACRPSLRTSTVAALWLAALVMTHILLAAVFAYVAACALLAVWLSRRATFGLASGAAVAGAGFGAAALCAIWLLPFVWHRSLAGRAATWLPPTFHEQIADVLEGQRLYDQALANLVIAGWVFVVFGALRGRRQALIPCAVAAGSIVAVHVVRGLYPGDVTSQMPWRSMTSIGVIALIPAATLIVTLGDWVSDLIAWAGRRAESFAPIVRHRSLLVELAGIAVCMTLVFGIDERSTPRGELTEPIPAMRATAVRLRELVPEGSRFAVEEDFPSEINRLGVIAPARWLAWASERNELNSFNPELNRASTAFAVREIHDCASGSGARLAALGVTHVVTTSEETALRLTRNEELELVEVNGPLRIWAVEANERADPRALLAVDGGTMRATYDRRSNERHRFTVEVSQDVSVTMAISYSPRWNLTIDGKSAKLTRTGDGRMQFDLPAGSHEIELDYGLDWRTIVGGVISVPALAGAGLILWRTRRRRDGEADQRDGEADVTAC